MEDPSRTLEDTSVTTLTAGSLAGGGVEHQFREGAESADLRPDGARRTGEQEFHDEFNAKTDDDDDEFNAKTDDDELNDTLDTTQLTLTGSLRGAEVEHQFHEGLGPSSADLQQQEFEFRDELEDRIDKVVRAKTDDATSSANEKNTASEKNPPVLEEESLPTPLSWMKNAVGAENEVGAEKLPLPAPARKKLPAVRPLPRVDHKESEGNMLDGLVREEGLAEDEEEDVNPGLASTEELDAKRLYGLKKYKEAAESWERSLRSIE